MIEWIVSTLKDNPVLGCLYSHRPWLLDWQLQAGQF